MIGDRARAALAGIVALAATTAAIVAGLAAVTQTRALDRTRVALAAERQGRAQDREAAAVAALVATQRAQSESDRRVAAIQEVLDATQPALDAARAAAGRLPDLDRRVRDAYAAVAACRRDGTRADDPAASAGGPAADETAGVLAELRRSAQEAEAARARYADEAAAAGERCERSYGALKPARPSPDVAGEPAGSP